MPYYYFHLCKGSHIVAYDMKGRDCENDEAALQYAQDRRGAARQLSQPREAQTATRSKSKPRQAKTLPSCRARDQAICPTVFVEGQRCSRRP